MAAILPVAGFALVWALVAARRAGLGYPTLSIRGAFVLAFLGFEAVLLVITEVLSELDIIGRNGVLAAWILVDLALLAAAWKVIGHYAQVVRDPRFRRTWRQRLAGLTWDDRVWIGVVVAIVGVLVVTAFMYPRPSNADSLVYHLTRVVHWIQDRTTAPFATHYSAQIDLSPLSEYNFLHLQLLSGTDGFDSGVQLLSAIVCLVGASELTRLLGGSRSAQVWSTVVCATLPSGILAATLTENDYFAAATGMCILILCARYPFGRPWVWPAAMLGTSIGIAYMAKGTVLILVAPAAAVLLVSAWRRRDAPTEAATGAAVDGLRRVRTIGSALVRVAFVGVIALAVVGVFLVQNDRATGSPLGSTASTTIVAGSRVAAVGPNVVRAVASNFDIGNGAPGPETEVSKVALDILKPAYDLFGVAQTNRDYSLVPTQSPFTVGNYSQKTRLSDFGANPWHVLLSVVALLVLGWSVIRGRRKFRVALGVGLGIALGFILFAGSARWSPFNVRYLIPSFVGMSCVVAVALMRFRRGVVFVVLALLVVACLPQLFTNDESSLASPRSYRDYLAPYFDDGSSVANANSMATSYETIAAVLQQSTCTEVGLQDWVEVEYPLWVAVHHDGWKGRIESFDVASGSHAFEAGPHPCAILRQATGLTSGNDDFVSFVEGDLVLLVSPVAARHMSIDPPGLTSTAPGIRLLPGGHWITYDLAEVLLGKGTLYVSSGTTARVRLTLRPVAGAYAGPVAVTAAGGRPQIMDRGPGVLSTTFEVPAGVSRVSIALGSNSAQLPVETATLSPG